MTVFEKLNQKLVAISKVPELKQKIVFTLLMFLVARVGVHIPIPGVDISKLSAATNQNGLLSYFNLFSGGAFKRGSLFALGIMPYINASIVMSLLSAIIPRLEEIQKEGEGGRNKITQWTRYLTIVIAIIQSFGIYMFLKSYGLLLDYSPLFMVTTIVTLTAGTVFLMWLGEQITLKGIGNGVSLLIFINVISRVPASLAGIVLKMQGSKFLVPVIVLIIAGGYAIVAAITLFQLGQRRIPIHYVGRGFSGKGGVAEKTYLPLKLNISGVMPVIFASVIMSIPALVARSIPLANFFGDKGATIITNMTSPTHPVYIIMYMVIIIFFSFFYTSIMFDPEKVADNLKQSGGTVPGIRPGAETADYLEKVAVRITWGGGFFLAIVAILPTLFALAMGTQVGASGTGILIAVGVALDTMQQIDAHLVTKEYKGFV